MNARSIEVLQYSLSTLFNTVGEQSILKCATLPRRPTKEPASGAEFFSLPACEGWLGSGDR
jgi:hypothetical protein